MKILTTALIGASIALAQAAAAQEVTLRFQHFISPKAAVPNLFMAPWADKIAEESEGRIAVELYPAMQLGGSPTALYDQIRDGVIDGGWAVPGYTPGRFPAAEVFELPFVGSTSAEATSEALWNFYETHLTDAFSDIHVLAVHVHGPGVIHTTGADIAALDDLEGLKLRTPTRVASDTLAALGVEPIGMPVPQLPEAMTTGVVDGGLIPWEIVPALRIHEIADAHTVIGGDRALYNTVFLWGMNKAVYDGLSDENRAVIDANSGAMASAWAGRAMDEGDEVGEALAREVGNAITVIEGPELDEMRARAEGVVEAWIAGAEGLPAAEMVEDARRLVAERSD